jgi:L-alanine-DL-glutamate epimerase-like enolase superfamily enzyme
MKITAVETILFQATWNDTFGQRPVHAAIKVRTDEGLVGNSRIAAAGVKVIEDYLAPALAGEDPRNTERLWARMARATREANVQATGIIGAVDVALWDLVGKAAGLPCWQLLGGYRDWVPAYADVPTYEGSPPAGSPEEVGEQLAACVEMGFDAVKFHILNRDPEDIVRQTRAARAAIGPGPRLMIDLFGWIDVRTAVAVCRQIEPYDLYWVEEPVLREDEPLGLALVARQTRIPVAGAENQRTIYGVRAILEGGGLTYLQTDIVGGGGYTSFRKMAALAEAYHVQLAPHGASRADLHAHLAAALPNTAILDGRAPVREAAQQPEIYAHVWQDFAVARGRVQLSSRPGLGLEFDEAFLRRHRVA